MNITSDNLYEVINFFGSMRQSLVVSAGMKAVEQEVIRVLDASNIFGNIVDNNGKKFYLKTSDKSRKTSTYELDAMFENDNEIILVDVKPSTHDNSTTADSHASKFKDVKELFQKTTNKKVRFVFAIYGNLTQTDIDNDTSYYDAMRKNGIECFSMKTKFNFCAEDIKKQLMLKDLERLVVSALNKGNGDQSMADFVLSLKNNA